MFLYQFTDSRGGSINMRYTAMRRSIVFVIGAWTFGLMSSSCEILKSPTQSSLKQRRFCKSESITNYELQNQVESFLRYAGGSSSYYSLLEFVDNTDINILQHLPLEFALEIQRTCHEGKWKGCCIGRFTNIFTKKKFPYGWRDYSDMLKSISRREVQVDCNYNSSRELLYMKKGMIAHQLVQKLLYERCLVISIGQCCEVVVAICQDSSTSDMPLSEVAAPRSFPGKVEKTYRTQNLSKTDIHRCWRQFAYPSRTIDISTLCPRAGAVILRTFVDDFPSQTGEYSLRWANGEVPPVLRSLYQNRVGPGSSSVDWRVANRNKM